MPTKYRYIVIIGTILLFFSLYVAMSIHKDNFETLKEIEEKEELERKKSQQEKEYKDINYVDPDKDMKEVLDRTDVVETNERIDANRALEELEYSENDHGWYQDWKDRKGNENLPELYQGQK